MFISQLVVVGRVFQDAWPHLVVLRAEDVVFGLIGWRFDACQIEQQMGQGVGHVASVLGLAYLLVDVAMLAYVFARAVNPEGNLELVVGKGPVDGCRMVAADKASVLLVAFFDVLAETVKKTAFKITRVGQLVGQMASERLGVEFGIVDLSLAPTPAVGDSVARVLEAMGLEVVGTHGTTAALALLNDQVKKGGIMACNQVGGLSGAFIPVSEDEGMIAAVQSGHINLEKLEAMTAICSVGLDMIAIPADTPDTTIAAMIADEAAIGVINQKTTAVRIIPYGKEGDMLELGGLLGSAPVMKVNKASSADFIARGGQIPAPVHSFKN